MHLATRNLKPVFAWQGLLIVLPVIVLAAVGISFLRQDRALALSEASERAQMIAADLAPRIWEDLVRTNADLNGGACFKVDSEGDLVFPPEYERFPVPKPLDPGMLDQRTAELWLRIQEMEQQPGRPTPDQQPSTELPSSQASDLINGYRQFLDAGPPPRFANIANYRMALLLVAKGDPVSAADLFKSLSAPSAEAVGESGLPLASLAQLHWVRLLAAGEIEPRSETSQEPTADEKLKATLSKLTRRALNLGRVRVHLDALCSNVINQPTSITPYILQSLMTDPVLATETNQLRAWESIWQTHERARQLYRVASGPLKQHGIVLFSAASEMAASNLSKPPSHAGQPRAFWFTITNNIEASVAHSENQVATMLPATDGGAWVCCRPEEEAGFLVNNRAAAIPGYLGLAVDVAGRRISKAAPDLHIWTEVNYMTRGGGGLKKELTSDLATKVYGTANAPGVDPGVFRVNLYLTSPSYLMRRQTARTFWVGSIIGVSAIGAFVGLLAGYRAFQRQLRLSELKSNFVSSVSHELRAPIASIRLMAESLDRGKVSEPPRQKEYFGFIVRECRRLSGLIENVLDFSRIDQGRKRYEFEETDVRTLVHQTVKLMEPAADEREVKLIEVTPEPGDSPAEHVVLDGRAIQQALINLIDNAIKHSPRSEQVTIGWERSGDALSLWVEDRGPGIPPEEQERIFERFYRLGSELRRETPGVGIGLSIVKHIVEAHQGQVKVQSAPGKGSRFTLEIPVCNES